MTQHGYIYFDEKKQGIKVMLFHNEWLHKALIEISDGENHSLYITPNRAKNLMSLLAKALERLPRKADE